MLELKRRAVGDLVTEVELLLVDVVVGFDLLAQAVLLDVLRDQLQLVLELVERLVILLTTFHDHLLEPIFVLQLLLNEFLSALVDVTGLLNLDAEEALLEHVHGILRAFGLLRNDFDALVSYSVGKKHSSVDVVRLVEVPLFGGTFVFHGTRFELALHHLLMVMLLKIV